ncbi:MULTISPECIES: hypothetical protein [unclassified Sphingobium]|uniref:hypothetical protein n=1 Tax=unclassified Sphingobium TaxID=2611147 RepID=UPI0035A60431
MTAIWEMVAFLCALVGGWLVLTSISPDLSAPQTAAQAAVGIGVAAIPYFIASMAQRAATIRYLKRLAKGEPSQSEATDSFLSRVKDFLVGD